MVTVGSGSIFQIKWLTLDLIVASLYDSIYCINNWSLNSIFKTFLKTQSETTQTIMPFRKKLKAIFQNVPETEKESKRRYLSACARGAKMAFNQQIENLILGATFEFNQLFIGAMNNHMLM